MRPFLIPIVIVIQLVQFVVRTYLSCLSFWVPFTVGAVMGYRAGQYYLAQSGGMYLYSWEQYVPIAGALFLGSIYGVVVWQLVNQIRREGRGS